MAYLFLALFVLLSGVHLYHSWLDDARHRAMTKPFLLLSLAMFYALAAKDISWVLLFALLTSWLGDVLLIPKGHRWFITGGVSFLISHFLFIAVYVPSVDLTKVPWLLIAVMAAVYGGISLRVIWAVKDNTPKIMVLPLYLYLIDNSLMNLVALMQLFSLRSAGAVVAYVGAVLFFVSDCVLYLVRCHKNPDLVFKRHFSVMLAYLSGECLITLGMLLIS